MILLRLIPCLFTVFCLALMTGPSPTLAQTAPATNTTNTLKGPIYSQAPKGSIEVAPADTNASAVKLKNIAPASTFKVDQSFNHQTTRFPLEGMHTKVTCETCHDGGVFKGTPIACAGCHNGSITKGKTLKHPKSSDICADCHNQFDFAMIHVDHSKIQTDCFSCHDGILSDGKSRTHIKSTNICEDCHLKSTWIVTRFNHENTVERCETCHDGLHTSGKPPTHIRSTNDCAQCHRTVSWKVGVFNHIGVVDGCFKCHDGIRATGKSGAHLPTSNDCQSCHTTVAWRPARFDHTDVSMVGRVCVDCHDGRRATGRSSAHFPTNTNDCAACHTSTTTWKPAKWDHALALDLPSCLNCHNGTRPPAQGKANAPSPHVPTNNNDCTFCHTNTANFTTWAGAKMDHAGITTGCTSCHNNTLIVGGKPVQGKTPTHIKTSNSCESCHIIGVTWKPATMPLNHSQVLGTCVSCHDGNQSISTGPIIGKKQDPKGPHLTTSDNCDVCHNTVKFTPALKFDHTQASNVANCAACHNGTTATGMLTGPNKSHITINGGQNAVCSDCHTNFSTWSPASFDHSKVSGVCATCHNGTTTMGAGKLLTAKLPTHIATNLGCENCHTTTTWKTSLFNHSQIGTATCVSCHDGAQATGKMNATIAHIPSDNNCVTCHTTTAWSPIAFDAVKHGLVSATCTDCHNGSQAISTGKLVSKPTPHLPIAIGQNCSDCHTSFTTWVTSFAHNAATMGTKTCVQCHDGVNAKGKKNAAVTHIPSTDVCSDCHKNFTAFSPAPFGAAEHALVSPTCLSCHNGTQAISTGKLVAKPTPHIATTANCADCHTSFTTWVTTFNHATMGAATCVSCHDGTLAKGKLPSHVPASLNCQNCHTTTAWLPVILPFNHSDPGVVGQACETCHNGLKATGRSKTHILTTSAACANCHTSTAVWTQIGATFHNFVVGTCFSCHDGGHSTATKLMTPKGTGHLATTDTCESCHTANITSWKPARMPFDHTQSKGTCLSCHDGSKSVSSGPVKPKTPSHVKSSGDCALCHTTIAFKPAVFSHTDSVVVATSCITCHNGTVANAKSKVDAAADANAPNHTPSTFNNCADCHTTTSFTPAHFDHGTVVGQKCSSCHDTGQTNAVVRPINHSPFNPATADCADCHTTATWVTNAKPDHSMLTAACVTCHNNNPTIGKPPATHLATNDACDSCHTTIAFKPATFDHTQANSVVPCAACHDGAHKISTGTITGKASFPAHPATSNGCELCHSGFVSWVTTKFDHTDPIVSKATCYSCHDGGHSPALARSPAHMASTTDCAACHNFTNPGFKPAVVVDHTQVTGTCVSCHDGAHSTSKGPVVGKSQTHIKTTAACDSCHNTTNKNFKPAVAVDHTQVIGTCYSCHDGGHTISTGPVMAKGPTHINATNNCVNCHNTVKFQPGLQPRGTDHSQVIGACFSCHNGSLAISTGPIVGKLQGPNGAHLPTANTCDTCHSVDHFTPALAFDHGSVAAGTCFTCHNNVQATGKSQTHMQSLNTCDDCHTTVLWKPVPVAQFKHTSAIGTCYSCHNGALKISTGTVTPRSANHIASSTNCDTCHKTTANWNVTVLQVDHTQVTGSCVACHNGTSKLSLTGGVISHKSPTHVNTTNNCDTCHAAGGRPWTPVVAFDHSAAIGTCFSCHDGAHSTSKGKITPKDALHLNTTNTCESCHVTTNWVVAPIKFDHSQALGTCAACHNGTNKMATSGIILDSKTGSHFITTNDCADCHVTTKWTTILTYTHISPAYVMHTPATKVTGCLSCHKQNNAKIAFAQPGLFPDCATCHSTSFKASAHLKYSTPKTTFYTFSELKDCTGACHIYTDQTLSTIKTSKPTFSHHRPTFSSWN
jgi:Cytochrome c7 and related cytochrome c